MCCGVRGRKMRVRIWGTRKVCLSEQRPVYLWSQIGGYSEQKGNSAFKVKAEHHKSQDLRKGLNYDLMSFRKVCSGDCFEQ